ncbi:MAG: hypothetical protein R3A44_10380 [Caldilineaceae bacterium]
MQEIADIIDRWQPAEGSAMRQWQQKYDAAEVNQAKFFKLKEETKARLDECKAIVASNDPEADPAEVAQAAQLVKTLERQLAAQIKQWTAAGAAMSHALGELRLAHRTLAHEQQLFGVSQTLLRNAELNHERTNQGIPTRILKGAESGRHKWAKMEAQYLRAQLVQSAG